MMTPAPRSVGLLLAGLPVALLPAWFEGGAWIAWPVFLGAALLGTGIDAVRMSSEGRLAALGTAPTQMFIGLKEHLKVSIELPGSRRAVAIELAGELDERLEPTARIRATIPPGAAISLALPLVPKRRGLLELRAVWLRWRSPWGLLRWTERQPLGLELAVVPDTTAARAMSLRISSERSALSGLKVERFLGDGSEFDALREFVPGLDSRAIDWKSSARHRSLLARQFRAERDHAIVVAVDTGHLMSEPLLGQPRLDHAIRAGLALAYVGLKTGDRVGLAGFDARLWFFVEPRRGASAFHRLRERSAQLEYGTAETNFLLSLTQLGGRLSRRCLIVVFTDFVDVITAEIMIERLGHLARRHVVVFVALRDPLPGQLVEAEPGDEMDVNRAIIAADLQRDRQVVLRRLRRSGVDCLDALPAQASASLVQRYLEIKRRERI